MSLLAPCARSVPCGDAMTRLPPSTPLGDGAREDDGQSALLRGYALSSDALDQQAAATAAARGPGEEGHATEPHGIQEALLDQPADPPQEFVHPIPLRTRRYMVGVFSLMAAMVFADQNLLAPHLTQVADDFGFDDTQKDTLLGGVIMACFFVVGAPAAMVVGWLTDKTNRRNLLFAVVVIGATPCLATYWVTQYWELVVLRTLTGVSVGGCFPLIYSLLGDLFPINQRSYVSAFVQIATGVGIAAGQGVSALTGQSNWRVPFVVVAVPNLIMAGIMLATTPEPPRGAFEEALKSSYAEGQEYKETITWPKVRALLKVSSNWLIIVQGLPGCLPWGMMLTFLNDYLSQNKGLSVVNATAVVLLFGVGGGIGVVGGGLLGQWLYNRKKEYMAVLMGVSVLLGIGPLFYLVNGDVAGAFGFACFMALLGGILSSVAGANLRAVLLNVNEPETRGVAFALQTVTDDLGKGLGPIVVAGFITQLGRTGAFNLSICGWVPCGILLCSLVFCIRKDEAAMQARLVARVEAYQAQAEANGLRSPSRANGSSGGVGPAGGELALSVLPPSGEPPTPPLPPSHFPRTDSSGTLADGGGGFAPGPHPAKPPSRLGQVLQAVTSGGKGERGSGAEGEEALMRQQLLNGGSSDDVNAAHHSNGNSAYAYPQSTSPHRQQEQQQVADRRLGGTPDRLTTPLAPSPGPQPQQDEAQYDEQREEQVEQHQQQRQQLEETEPLQPVVGPGGLVSLGPAAPPRSPQLDRPPGGGAASQLEDGLEGGVLGQQRQHDSRDASGAG